MLLEERKRAGRSLRFPRILHENSTHSLAEITAELVIQVQSGIRKNGFQRREVVPNDVPIVLPTTMWAKRCSYHVIRSGGGKRGFCRNHLATDASYVPTR
jgi:hypothetical protein